MLAAVTLTDLEQRIIPNKILLAGAILCLAIAAPTDPSGLPERAIAAAAAGGVFFLVVFAYPKGMGLGDVKLAATMGLFLGRAVAPAILAALLVGSRRRPRLDRPPRLQAPARWRSPSAPSSPSAASSACSPATSWSISTWARSL